MFYLILSVVVLVICLFTWINTKLKYWENKNVTQSIPFSYLEHFFIITRKSQPEKFLDLYYKSPDERYIGVYQLIKPILLIKDPELIKKITVKEFDSFLEHQAFAVEDFDPLWGKNLVAAPAQRWKKLRPLLSPAFTSSKMRMMFVLMEECAKQFTEFFLNEKKNLIELEMKDVFTRFTNDVIATTAFGLKCDSLKNQDNEFYTTGKEATEFGLVMLMKFLVNSMSPLITNLLRIRIFSKKIQTYFTSIIEETIRVREEQKIVRPDLIHLLMETRKGNIIADEESINGSEGFSSTTEANLGGPKQSQHFDFTLEDMVAQAFIFFIAGFDTVSTAMCFLAYELAVNPEIQDKLREDVDEVFDECGGNVTYEAILSMKYMDMVVSEVLRKWPPSPITDRVATRNFTIEPELPGEKPVTLEKGAVIMLPIFAIHRDPKYYPNPETFDPERFNEDNKKNIGTYTYIPFGAGPRNCIGSRFALLEVKLIIFYILKNFSIVPTEKSQIPLKLDRKKFNLAGEGGYHLGFKRRNAL